MLIANNSLLVFKLSDGNAEKYEFREQIFRNGRGQGPCSGETERSSPGLSPPLG